MSNGFHIPLSALVVGSIARAGDVNDRIDAVTTAFDKVEAVTDVAIKLPAGSGNQQITETGPNRAGKEIGFDVDGNLVLIQSAFQWRDDWVTGVDYLKNDVVRDIRPESLDDLYTVMADHTSGDMGADIASGKLVKSIDVSQIQIHRSAAEQARSDCFAARSQTYTYKNQAQYWATHPNVTTVSDNMAHVQAVSNNMQAVVDGSALVRVSETEPTAIIGKLWFQPSTYELKVYRDNIYGWQTVIFHEDTDEAFIHDWSQDRFTDVVMNGGYF